MQAALLQLPQCYSILCSKIATARSVIRFFEVRGRIHGIRPRRCSSCTISMASQAKSIEACGLPGCQEFGIWDLDLGIWDLISLAAMRRPSLTTWILISIVVGAAFGYFFPAAATELRILSTIFIRLIRTIVAPLLFATLVVGIASHGNLKQVGRMGVKAIIYLEIVTTLALLIGWAAITVSRAGVGITLPPPEP